MHSTAPLSKGFLLTSIIGFVISAYNIYPISKPWGFTFCLMFSMGFIASMISLSGTAADYQYSLEKRAMKASQPNLSRQVHYVFKDKKSPRKTSVRKPAKRTKAKSRKKKK